MKPNFLQPVVAPSTYFVKKKRVNVPARMAWLAPGASDTLQVLLMEVPTLFISDMYRTPEDQDRAHMDYKLGRKSAYSPPAGGSWHEVGRAIDVDVDALNGYAYRGEYNLAAFWKIAQTYGWTPIIEHPVSAPECWHFEYQGTYAKLPRPWNIRAAYMDAYGHHPQVDSKKTSAFWLQCALGRLNHHVKIDGIIGPKTLDAILTEAGTEHLPTAADTLYSYLHHEPTTMRFVF